MKCIDAGPLTELEFIRRVRGRERGTCTGPVLVIPLGEKRTSDLEDMLGTPRAVRLLWQHVVHVESDSRFHFRFCAAHWMDLHRFLAVRAETECRNDWAGACQILLKQICRSARWDPKEVANLIGWLRVTLT